MCVLTQRRMSNLLSKSAVIRARHLPDVNGVNRYKYFHRATATVDIQKTNALSSSNKPSNSSTKKKVHNGTEESTSSTKAKGNKQKQVHELSVTNLNAGASSSTLPPISTNKNSKVGPTKRLNSTWPTKDESLLNGKTNDFSPSNGTSTDNGLTKRSQSVSSLRNTDLAFLGKITPRSSSSWTHRQKVSIKEFGTQTENSSTHLAAFSTPTIVAPEPMQIEEHGQNNNTPKATQTNNLYVLSRLSIHSLQTVDDLEQRTKLLEIVDEALDQTIDKNSRQRVNELIASSARKQAEVWRDAKEFVSTVLLPQSVAMANKARSGRSPIEAIANMHFP